MSDNENYDLPFTSLILRGKELDPLYITDLLGLLPSRSFKRGDKRTETKLWPHGYWEFSSADQIQAGNLQEHLEWLVSQLSQKQQALAEILQHESINGFISCFWILSASHDSLLLNSQLLEQVMDLKLDINFDIYCPHTKEDEM